MKKRILKVVLGAHLIWLILSILFYNPEAFFRPKQKIRVNTVVLAPPPPPATKVVAVSHSHPKPKGAATKKNPDYSKKGCAQNNSDIYTQTRRSKAAPRSN